MEKELSEQLFSRFSKHSGFPDGIYSDAFEIWPVEMLTGALASRNRTAIRPITLQNLIPFS